MKEEKTRTSTITEYFSRCKECGKRYRLRKTGVEDLCDLCVYRQRERERRERAEASVAFLLGASIVAVKPYDCYGDTLKELRILTKEGKGFVLTSGGYEENCIDLEEL